MTWSPLVWELVCGDQSTDTTYRAEVGGDMSAEIVGWFVERKGGSYDLSRKEWHVRLVDNKDEYEFIAWNFRYLADAKAWVQASVGSA